MSTETRDRLALRMQPETKQRIEQWYRADNCKSQNEFVEKAVNFYADYLAARDNSLLPAAAQSAIDGRLGMFENRMAKLLYKLAVEMDMGMSAVLDCVQVDDDYLRKLRSDSVRNVKATNGLLTFEQKVRDYEDTEGNAQWQD